MTTDLSEIEAWILSYLATSKEQWETVTPEEVIREAPQSLIMTISTAEQVLSVLGGMQSKKYVDLSSGAGLYTQFYLQPDGLLQFRKFLNPLTTIAQNESQYSAILDKTVGDQETKKEFKKLLKTLKGKVPDKASDEIITFLKSAGREGIFYAIRLIFGN